MTYKFVLQRLVKSQIVLVAFVLSTVVNINAQGLRKVTGNVKNEQNEPLPGVTVLVEGTNNGTITDQEGSFTLKNVNLAQAVLIISSVGYATQRLPLNGKSVVNITLNLSSKNLGQLVVIGYGSQKSSLVTGAISKIGSKELNNDLSVGRVDQALMGKIPGLMVQQNSGAPGRPPDLEIRGTGSISFSNSPLYVVDGFPIQGDIGFLDPDNIESIEVLKDAASAAIYGSRAANGVILVTTKEGQSGKASINFNAYYGLQNTFSKVPVMNRDQWIQFAIQERNNSWELQGGKASDPNSVRPSAYQIDPLWLSDPNSLPNNDWQKIISRVAPVSNYQLSASAGTDKFKYYISGGYFNKQGIIVNSYYNRFSVQANVEANISNYLNIGLNFSGTISDKNDPETDSYGGAISRAIEAPPVIPIDGNTQETGYYPYAASFIVNPYIWLKSTTENTKETYLMPNLYIDIKILNGLTWKSTIGILQNNEYYQFFIPNNVNRGKGSYGTDTSGNDLTLLTQHTLHYKLSRDNWSADLLAGATYQNDLSSSMSVEKTGFPNGSTIQTLNVASTLVSGTSTSTEWRQISFFGRANFAWKDKYLLTSSIRRDGSSRFGIDNRWGWFPSLSLGWRLTQEKFMQNIKWISNLKLRVSDGEVGNNDIGNYASIATLQTVSTTLGNPEGVVEGLRPADFSNNDLGWEKDNTINIGVDLGLFKGRIKLTADAYNRVSKGLLLNVPIPQTTGFATALQNIGSVRNRGLELDLNTANLNGAFTWRTNFNVSFNRNKVLQLGPNNAPILGTFDGYLLTITEVGQPIGMYYLLQQAGVFMNQSELEKDPTYNKEQLGDIRYLDYNHDGVINSEDIHIDGNPHPDFIWGMTNTFSFKNLTLNIFVQGLQGADGLNLHMAAAGQSRANLHSYWLNRWQSPQDPGNGWVPRAAVGPNMTTPSTFWLYNGSYWAIRNVTIGYTFTKKIIHGIAGLRIYASCSNIYMYDHYHHNPLTANYSDTPLIPNVDDASTYPIATTYSLGINLKL